MNTSSNRRDFIGKVITGAAILGLPSFSPLGVQPVLGQEGMKISTDDPEAWLNKINGKHRIVLDVTRPHEIFPFAWAKVFLMTNQATDATENNCCAVVVLRHEAIPYAMKDELWEKYKFGEMFKVDDPKTKAPATRNPFWMPKPGDFSVPGIGNVEIGINELQSSGVLFGVCNMAITVYSAVVAQKTSADPQVVKQEWIDGLLPGIQPVPSGMWAIGRAQERNCGYCFTG
jgi:hypothetical protein